MTTATEIYIERVNKAPCGTTNIHLYAGADSSDSLKIKGHNLTCLKGTKMCDFFIEFKPHCVKNKHVFP